MTADIASLPTLKVAPTAEPTQVTASAPVGQMAGVMAVAPSVQQNRAEHHRANRLQSTAFRIAAQIVKDAHQDANRQQLFPQVLRLVQEYLTTKIDLSDEAQIEDVALAKYRSEIAERIRTALRPATPVDTPPILPVLDSYKPEGRTDDVAFNTMRKVWRTTKSHISHVVLESNWEKRTAQILESISQVAYYARNYKLDFTIPYRFAEASHFYVPDFIVVLEKMPGGPQLKLVLEIKGEEDERDRAKAAGAQRWVDAVNYAGRYGRWHYEVCKDVYSLRTKVEEAITIYT